MMILRMLERVFGSKQKRDMRKMRGVLDRINGLEAEIRAMTDERLKAQTAAFRERISHGESLEDLLPEAIAVFREATFRILGEGKMVRDEKLGREIPFMAHFDVQVLGAVVLHRGTIAEMKTGEGKTQVAAMSAYLNALTGKGVHVITVNDYLARRDSEWMGKIYTFLGLTVGCLDKTEPSTAERSEQYRCDITYGTNNEFGFDYLRDNMASSPEQLVQRELNYAIIDEVDNILIDEARTPLIISGPVTRSNKEYEELKPRITKVVGAQNQLTQKIVGEIEVLLKQIAREPGREKEYEAGFKLLTVRRGAPKNKRLIRLLKEGGAAKMMKTVETDYLREKKLHEIDEELFYTMDESGHSAELTDKGRALISGANPDFFIVPDLVEMLNAVDADTQADAEEKARKKDEAHRIYADRSERIHCVEQLLRAYSLFERDVDYVVQNGQILIVDEFTGRILHGRRYSEGLHQALEAKEGVRVAGENQTLATITFQNFFKMYAKVAGMTGTAATEAQEFMEIYKLDVITIPTNRPMIREDHDDEIYKTQREKYNAIVEEITTLHEKGVPILVGTTSIEKSELLSKLLTRGGISHDVLNAKQHAREALIVSQAGRLGAVTIATNMAGRGTDIVLGGNFEAMANQELYKEGIDPDELTLEEKRSKFRTLYEKTIEEHARVVELGGLAIIGTERHESRRIDNQLRGRSGRQGDPGASKFFLSLDDDLMRIFGSERMIGIMDRLGAEEGEAISHPFVSRAIGNAQKRVEGRNFDIRKHLKEYDDVMNLQRTEIYGLRQRILKGEDIKDEIFDQIAAWIEGIIYKNTSKAGHPEDWNWEALFDELQRVCGIAYRVPREKVTTITQESLFDEVWRAVKERYREKEEHFGEAFMRRMERGLLLMVIDNLWKDHLYEMDHLKSGVQYRAFGQKNPLYEYQREGLAAFEELRAAISREITGMIFRTQTMVEEEDRMGLGHSQTVHSDFDIFSSDRPQPARQPQPARSSPLVTNRSSARPVPVRVGKQVGRNDPCPCGSGKKYKKCCGRM